MPQARGDSLLQLTENRETLIQEASEQAAVARTLKNEQFYSTSESVMNGNSSALFLCREYSETMSSQYSRLQTVLTDHVKIAQVTGIETL